MNEYDQAADNRHYEMTAKSFEENGYLVLTDALSRDECKKLTEHMYELDKNGKLTKDPQCPLSGAIYGDPVFDDIMAQFTESIGKQIGKELLPTYTYARLYQTGEELKRHKDRPSCEISATMTLGFDENDKVWPIYFDENKERMVLLDVGEMAVYKGCEVEHWRPKFKGKWQVQVFMHYVDANGPYKDHIFDGRKELGTPKGEGFMRDDGDLITTKKKSKKFKNYEVQNLPIPWPTFDAVLLPKTQEEHHFPGYIGFNSEIAPDIAFTKEECEKIISFADNDYGGSARIGGNNVERKVRSADVYNIFPEPEWRWVHEKVCRAVHVANRDHFRYDVNTISHGLQLIHYKADEKVPGHYKWHIDAGPGESATRKISFTVQLSDPDTYTGCNLLVNDHGDREIKAIRDQGSLSMFPSYMPHCVTPIESGERYALVIWVHGPKPFR